MQEGEMGTKMTANSTQKMKSIHHAGGDRRPTGTYYSSIQAHCQNGSLRDMRAKNNVTKKEKKKHLVCDKQRLERPTKAGLAMLQTVSLDKLWSFLATQSCPHLRPAWRLAHTKTPEATMKQGPALPCVTHGNDQLYLFIYLFFIGVSSAPCFIQYRLNRADSKLRDIKDLLLTLGHTERERDRYQIAEQRNAL